MKGFFIMALQYKINILEALKEKGYSTYVLRQKKLLSESTIQKLRVGEGVAWDNLDTLCRLLNCDIGDILRYNKEDNWPRKGIPCFLNK